MSIAPAESSVASLSLAISFDPAINYAFQQNEILVVKELRFQNDDVARKDLFIRVTTLPAFAASKAILESVYISQGMIVGSRNN